jgi:hypothetical protein
MAEIFVDSLYSAVVDCLRVIPILYLSYLLVSFISHDHSHKLGKFISRSKKTSVVYASFLGCIPQCGFSSVIADFYSESKVSLGTLIAVFIATSDEAIPLMLTNSNSILPMLMLIGIKVLLALVWGFAIDGVVGLLRKFCKKPKAESVEPLQEEAFHEHHEHHHGCGHIHSDECDQDCGHEKECCVDNVFLDAYYHTFEIVIYLFLATFILNFLIAYANFAGVDIISKVLTDNVFVQILVAGVVGLIPNCASSVLLVELYLAGSLAFPALVAGLTSCAGVGMVILWTKNHKKPLQNLLILLLQFAIGIASGMLLTLIF